MLLGQCMLHACNMQVMLDACLFCMHTCLQQACRLHASHMHLACILHLYFHFCCELALSHSFFHVHVLYKFMTLTTSTHQQHLILRALRPESAPLD